MFLYLDLLQTILREKLLSLWRKRKRETERSNFVWRVDDDGAKKKCGVTTTCGDVRVLQSNHLVSFIYVQLRAYVKVLFYEVGVYWHLKRRKEEVGV